MGGADVLTSDSSVEPAAFRLLVPLVEPLPEEFKSLITGSSEPFIGSSAHTDPAVKTTAKINAKAASNIFFL
jgi:hypothetical protein